MKKRGQLHTLLLLTMLCINTSWAQSYQIPAVKKTWSTQVTKEGKLLRTITTEIDRKGRNVSVTTRKADSQKFQREEFSYRKHQMKIDYYDCRDTDASKKLKKTEIITRDFLGKISQREIIYPDTTRNRTTTYEYDRFNRKIAETEERNHQPYRKRTKVYNSRGQLIRQQTFDAKNECIYDKTTIEK